MFESECLVPNPLGEPDHIQMIHVELLDYQKYNQTQYEVKH